VLSGFIKPQTKLLLELKPVGNPAAAKSHTTTPAAAPAKGGRRRGKAAAAADDDHDMMEITHFFTPTTPTPAAAAVECESDPGVCEVCVSVAPLEREREIEREYMLAAAEGDPRPSAACAQNTSGLCGRSASRRR
jgi:hypothetical protein